LSGGSLPDAVAREAGMSIPDAVTTLIQLELRGLIESVGGRYERRHRPSAPAAR
jgi:predicted Rossmann fold nucleotide-binding protein DprA/Smf involved in DNA uptake